MRRWMKMRWIKCLILSDDEVITVRSRRSKDEEEDDSDEDDNDDEQHLQSVRHWRGLWRFRFSAAQTECLNHRLWSSSSQTGGGGGGGGGGGRGCTAAAAALHFQIQQIEVREDPLVISFMLDGETWWVFHVGVKSAALSQLTVCSDVFGVKGNYCYSFL